MNHCLAKISLSVWLCFSALFLAAQKTDKTYGQQISLITENDSYTLKIIDRYYTSGVFLRYSKALPTRQKKKIVNAEIGQTIYTAYDTRKSFYYYNLDRPYTGFLYLKGGLSYFFKNENVFQWNGLIGVTGEAAQGQEVQRIIHKLLGFRPAYGWEAQLKTDYGINAQASYTQHLIKTEAKKSFDAFVVSDAMLGTTFTKFSAGILFRLGALEPAYNSAWWDARINHSANKETLKHHELFFYFQPSIIAQVYNATLEGGMFTDQGDQFTAKEEPFIYQHKFGLMYARNRWTAQLGYTYRTKEAKFMIGKEVYGTIALAYRF